MRRMRSAAAGIVTAAALLSSAFPGGVAWSDPAGTVVDSFTRADSSSLGAAETGQSWAVWTGKARVVAQQAEVPASRYNLAVVDSGLSAGTAAVTVPVVSPEFWLVLRAADKANYWRFGRWQGGAYQLQKIVKNSVGSLVLEALGTVTPALGDRLSCTLASSITCSVNGTPVVRTADAFGASATHVGLAGGGSAVTRFDDLLVQAPEQPSQPLPDVRVAVTAGSPSAATGADVSWTATVTNAGSGPATASVATVSMPQGLTGATLATSAGTCAAAASGWTCSLGDRAAGSVATLTLHGTAPSQPGTLTLTVGAAAQETDADPADNTDSASVTTSTPPPPGAIVADGFGRADAASLGQAETGQPWAAWAGSAGVVAQEAQTSGTGYALAVVDTGVTAGVASVRVPALSPEFWLVVRAADAGNYWRFGRWQDGGYQLQQVVAGGLGSPALTVLSTVTPAAGDVLSCSSSSTMTCSVNGTGVVRTSDAPNGAARFVGFAAGGSSARFDDVLVTPVPPAPDLHVEVAAAAATVDAGAQASWTATVTNEGTATATAATVTVTVPAGLTSTTASASAGSCTPGSGTYTCTIGDRAPSSSATVTVSGTAPGEEATLTLTASAAAQEQDGDPADDTGSASVTVRVPPPADAAAADSFTRPDAASLGQAETGQPWSTWSGAARVAGGQAVAGDGAYTAVVVDSGTSSGTAAVTVPALSPEYWLVVRGTDAGNYWRFGRWQGGGYQLQQIAGSALGSPALTVLGTVAPAAGDRLSCSLASGLACSVNGTAVVSTADTFNATGRLTGLAAMGVTRFDDVLVTLPQPGPDLRVTLTAAAATVAPDADVSWTATVTNNGTAPATSTVVTVAPPAALVGTSVTSSAGLCLPAGGTWRCNVGNRAVGSSLTVSVSGDAPSTPGPLTLTVSADADGSDLDPSTDSASSTVTVQAAPAPGTALADGFGRADSASLGQAETGQFWTTWAGTARVVGQQAEASGSGYTLAVADSGVTAGTAWITVPTVTTEFWLVVRATDSANYWRFGRWQGGPYQLQQVVNNGLGSPALTTSATVTPSAGDRLSCKLGTGLACSVNATAVVSTDDAFNASGRLTGFAAAGAGVATRFDDVLHTAPASGPDLRVAVTATSGSVTTGGAVGWTATVANDGTATATGATATVTPPTGVTGVVVSSPSGVCLPSGGIWTCLLGTRPVGSVATMSVSGTAPAQPATVTLHVSATSSETDTDTSNNAASASVSVRAPAAPGDVVVDDFNRPDSATLGQADSGQPWTTWTGGFGISGGAAAPSGTGTSMATLDPGWTYGTYEVKVTSGASAGFSVVLRGRDQGNHFRVGADANGSYRMWKVVNGSASELQFSIRRADVPARDGDLIRIVNRPDDGIFVSVNGEHVLDGGDTALLGESRFGLAAASGSVRFDGVWISQLMSSGVTTTDGFNDPEGAEIDTADSGTRYRWWTPSGQWRARSGRATHESAGYGLAWIDTSTERAGVSVTATTGTQQAWLVFRYSESGDYYRLGRRTGGTYVVERVANGQASAAPGTLLATISPRDGDRLEVRQSTDGTIECLVNGVRLARFVDSTFNLRTTASGLAGEGAQFDDFVVTSY